MKRVSRVSRFSPRPSLLLTGNPPPPRRHSPRALGGESALTFSRRPPLPTPPPCRARRLPAIATASASPPPLVSSPPTHRRSRASISLFLLAHFTRGPSSKPPRSSGRPRGVGRRPRRLAPLRNWTMGRSPVYAFVALLLAVFAVVSDGRNHARLLRKRLHKFGGVMKKHSMKEIISTASPREQNRLKYPKDTTACEMVHLECLTKRKEANKTKLKEQCAWALSEANKALHKAELTAVNRLIKVSGRTRFVAVREMTRPVGPNQYTGARPPIGRFVPAEPNPAPPNCPPRSWAVSPSPRSAFFPLVFPSPVCSPHTQARGVHQRVRQSSDPTTPDPRPPRPLPSPIACHRTRSKMRLLTLSSLLLAAPSKHNPTRPFHFQDVSDGEKGAAEWAKGKCVVVVSFAVRLPHTFTLPLNSDFLALVRNKQSLSSSLSLGNTFAHSLCPFAP